ncbi:hypothetical protein SAMN02745866_02926 [Alteromonadaceae bacterium Bs31]|nr:hypothetical protein SAMN02745866_02926 [Alteromonadaceae bacterium Bs31]
MRWIFFSLLFLNAVLLVWGMVFASPAPLASSQSAPFKYSDVETLVLLSESTHTDLANVNDFPESGIASGELDTGSAPPSKDENPLCEMVGPFKDSGQADLFLERLAAIDISAELKELELPAGSRYQIYLNPEGSHKEALRKLTELQSRKIDSYIIPKGELANGISLGMFSHEDLAEQHLKKMRSLGLKPEKKVIERTYWENWVMLAPGEAAKMSSLAWGRVMEGINDIERRQNFCLDVASQDNIH